MSDWPEIFRHRIDEFQHAHPVPGAVPVSIKVRVPSGCFHREHSPVAYGIIDEHLQDLDPQEPISFEEHESGPEILVYVIAGLTFTTAVINLVAAVLKARSEGIKRGDRDYPAELIVRRVHGPDEIREEIVLRADSLDKIDPAAVAKKLSEAADKLLGDQ